MTHPSNFGISPLTGRHDGAFGIGRVETLAERAVRLGTPTLLSYCDYCRALSSDAVVVCVGCREKRHEGCAREECWKQNRDSEWLCGGCRDTDADSDYAQLADEISGGIDDAMLRAEDRRCGAWWESVDEILSRKEAQ